MKKILIMIMSCNEEHFIKEEEICRQTFLNNLPNNIDYIIYKGGEKSLYDTDKHLLVVKCEDDLYNTFKKTYIALEYVNAMCDYDYIFRTNTSTYVNIPLLNYYVNHLTGDTGLHGGELINKIDGSHYKYPYLRGNALLLSKKAIDILLNNGLVFATLNTDERLQLIDDEIIGAIFNSYWMIHKENLLSKLNVFKEGWYKAIPEDGNYPSSICNMNNINLDFNYLKQFMIIQIRNWYDRTLEYKHFFEIDNVFKTNTDNEINKTFNDTLEYNKNPDVFLSHNHGFVLYNNLFNKKKDEG